jgi:hypothetical protein
MGKAQTGGGKKFITTKLNAMRVLLLMDKAGNPTKFLRVPDEALEEARELHKDEIMHEGESIQECILWLNEELKKRDWLEQELD